MIITRRKALFIPLAPAIIGLAKPSAAQLLTTGAGPKPGGVSNPPLTWNPADAGAGMSFANSNRQVLYSTGGNTRSVRSTVSYSSGKIYVEGNIGTVIGDGFNQMVWAVGKSDFSLTNYPGSTDTSGGFLFNGTGLVFSASLTRNALAGTGNVATGMVLMMAIDLTNGLWAVGADGTWWGSPAANPATSSNMHLSWTPGGSWFVACGINSGDGKNGPLTLPSATTFAAPSGYTVGNA